MDFISSSKFQNELKSSPHSKLDKNIKQVLGKNKNYYNEEIQISEVVPIDLFVNGAEIGDVPISYVVKNIMPYERPVIGMYVDINIMPGFKYKVRKLAEDNMQSEFLFNAESRYLISLGTGYTKRFTFQGATLNNNKNYFWSDSNQPHGFGFSLEALTIGQTYIIHAPSQFNYANENSMLIATLNNSLENELYSPPYERTNEFNFQNLKSLKLSSKNQLVSDHNVSNNIGESMYEYSCHNPIGQAIITTVINDGDCQDIKTNFLLQKGVGGSKNSIKIEKWVPVKFSCLINFTHNPMNKIPLKKSEFTFKGVAMIVKEGSNNVFADTRQIHNIFIPNFGKCVLVRA